MVRVVEDVEIIERVAALDIGKAEVVCCVRVPDESRSGRGAGRCQQVRTFATMTRSLTELSDWLTGLQVTRVVMEATSDYWKPPFYLLEAAGFEVWLVNAHEVKHLPGRPKTDALDAVWLCKIAERQMIRASFVPPAPIRRLRDLTRYRVDLIGDRGREKNRVEKLLEDAGIKLSVVASDLFGVSGRAMMDALIAGEHDPDILADLARTRLRARIPELREALTGHFIDHHGFLLTQMLRHLDHLEGRITAVEAQIEDHIRPYADTVARLDQIPGVGAGAAAAIIAEIGTDMTRFPTAAHLASWGSSAPPQAVSRPRPRATPPPDAGTATWPGCSARPPSEASRTNTFLGERYRRIARRRGKMRAVVAVGRSILTVIWHLLSDPTATFTDL